MYQEYINGNFKIVVCDNKAEVFHNQTKLDSVPPQLVDIYNVMVKQDVAHWHRMQDIQLQKSLNTISKLLED